MPYNCGRCDWPDCDNPGCGTPCGRSDCTNSLCNPGEPMRSTNKGNTPARRRACGYCGRLGHLTRTCANPRKAHNKIGVEIEGWWLDLNATKERAQDWHMSGAHDGSLAHDNTGETQPYEFRTRPGSLGEAISQVIAIYPDKCDKSAGMHVHMSFADPMDVTSLATPQFLDYFRDRWNAWGTRMRVQPSSDFWSRLRGENEDYCAITHLDYLRGNLARSPRYHQLNFSSWERHKTLEMRMLPLFRDARLAVLALEEWVSIVEDFIQHVAPSVWAAFDRECPMTGGDEVPEVQEIVELGHITEDRSCDLGVLTPAPIERIRTINLDEVVTSSRLGTIHSPAVRVIEREVTIVEPTPALPGYVRVFGGQSAARQAIARQLQSQGVF